MTEHSAEISLTVEQARLIWELAILTEDRELEEEAALAALAEQLDAAGEALVDHEGHLIPMDLAWRHQRDMEAAGAGPVTERSADIALPMEGHVCRVVQWVPWSKLWRCPDCWSAYRLTPEGHVPDPLDGLASLPSDPRDLVSPEDRARVQANLEEMARQRQRAEPSDGDTHG